jgi:hypothetical protein
LAGVGEDVAEGLHRHVGPLHALKVSVILEEGGSACCGTYSMYLYLSVWMYAYRLLRIAAMHTASIC